MSDLRPAGRERDLGIDLLRGIAILGVVVFHLWGFTTGTFAFPPRHSVQMAQVGGYLKSGDLLAGLTSSGEILLHSGRDGVSLFITLSGIALTMAALTNGMPNWITFYQRRLSRLLRAYWAGIAVVVLSLALLAIVKTDNEGGSFRYNWTHVGIFPYFDMDQLYASIFLLPRLWKLHWSLAPPNPLWFVALIFQFYLLFPLLFRLTERYGVGSVLAGSLVLSVASTAGLLLQYGGHLGVHGWITTIWFPFRIFDFVLGMALGYLLVLRREQARKVVGGAAPTVLCLVGGIALYLLGARIDDGNGYFRTVAFPLMAAGLATAGLPLLVKAPGRVEVSLPGRTLIWMGPMSLAVLIMNEPFRYIDHYLWLKGYTWTPGWWLFIVALYVPGTLVTAALLGRALRLTPAGHPMQLLRGPTVSRRARGATTPVSGYQQVPAPHE